MKYFCLEKLRKMQVVIKSAYLLAHPSKNLIILRTFEGKYSRPLNGSLLVYTYTYAETYLHRKLLVDIFKHALTATLS